MKNPMFRSMQRSMILAVLLVLGLAGQAIAQEINAPEDTDRGVIQEIDFAKSEVIVSGNRYAVTTTAKVEINGSYGAFTMLETGMRIEFNYRKFSDGERQIFEIRELAAGEEMEEA